MKATGNSAIIKRPRVTIRISRNYLSFTAIDQDASDRVIFEPYTVKSGISMAANLREAFKTSDLLSQNFERAQILLDAPVLIVPIEEYDEEAREAIYQYSFPDVAGNVILSNTLPDTNSVAVYSINKDLKLVIDDHFPDVRFIPLMQPIWSHLHQKSFTGVRRKQYAYFHDDKVDVFSFDKNRFKFCNSFDAAHSRDAVYFLLYVWKQLVMDSEKDELHLVGDIPDKDWMMEALHRFIAKVYVINPTADFNRAPITEITHIAQEHVTLFIPRSCFL